MSLSTIGEYTLACIESQLSSNAEIEKIVKKKSFSLNKMSCMAMMHYCFCKDQVMQVISLKTCKSMHTQMIKIGAGQKNMYQTEK